MAVIYLLLAIELSRRCSKGAMTKMTKSWWPWGWKLGLTSFCLMGGAGVFWAEQTWAQIIPDNTLPVNTTVTPQGNTSLIEGGTRAGGNLFHSFSQFNVSTGGTAHFNNALDVRNIFTRVQGSSVSNIDGILKANGTANLFLINPNGIIFGPNASLNVGGSFVATTSNGIGFGDRGFFSASTKANNDPSLLTVNPSALFFNRIPTQAIANQAKLQVTQGNSLLLLGGNVSLDGGWVVAPGGHIELGGVSEAGTVGLNINGNKFSLNFPSGVQRANISLSNGADVNVQALDGGSIAINADNLNLAGGSKIRAGSSGNNPAGSQSGNVDINATGAITLSDTSFITNVLAAGAVGNAGNINIATGSLSATNGSRVLTVTSGQGNAGSVNINAKDSVSFDGANSTGTKSSASTNVASTGVGNVGDVNITTGKLSISNGATLSTTTNGQGDAGSVNINAKDTVSVSGTNSGIASTVGFFGVGNAGNINIQAQKLTLSDSAKVATSSFGTGNPGSILVNVTDSVSLSNGSLLQAAALDLVNAGNVIIKAGGTVSFDGIYGYVPSGVSTSVIQSSLGNAGKVDIQAQKLILSNGAQVITSTSGDGNAGSILVNVSDSVSVSNGSTIQALTYGNGNAGNITITAGGKVSFDGVGANGLPSAVYTYAEPGFGPVGTGKGGDIKITAGSLSISNGAAIDASTYQNADAGNVTIDASDTVSLSGQGSEISSIVADSGVGNGGSISIRSRQLTLSDTALLTTSTVGNGNAGNITINTTDAVGVSSGAIIRSLANGQGDAGNVTITAGGKVSFDGSAPGVPTALQSTAGVGYGVLGKGNGGDINITAFGLSVSNGAQINASTLQPGNGGNVTINVSDIVSLTGNNSIIGSAVGPFAVGNGGKIDIRARQLNLSNSAQLATSTVGNGNAGSILVNASDSVRVSSGSNIQAATGGQGNAGKIAINTGGAVFLDGSVLINDVNVPGGIFTFTGSGSGLLSTGKSGEIDITAESLFLSNGSQINSSTLQQADAGNVNIFARDTVSLSGQNTAILTAVTPLGVGKGGDVNIQTRQLLTSDSAQIATSTTGKGNAGNITINASDSIAVSSGSIVQAATAGQGNGGNITVNAPNSITLSGVGSDGLFSGLYTSVELNAKGNGGNMTVQTGKFFIQNGAQVTASTSKDSSGNAGDIVKLTAQSLTLDGGSINTTSFSGEGGNISNLQVQNLLLLRNGSSISTTAGKDNASRGNGGNININSGFIATTIAGNSHITANAYAGNGGNITINTQGIFGINSQIGQTLNNNITATSQLGINGTIQINTPGVDPSRGLVALPTNLFDASRLIAQRCAAEDEKTASQFVVTGRGGLSPNPGEVLSRNVVWEDARHRTVTASQHRPSNVATTSPSKPVALVPATGWVFNGKGEVTFTAAAPNINSNFSSNSPSCRVP